MLHFGNWILCLSLSSLQPNVDTRQKQLAAWCSLALSYCRHHKLYTLDVLEAQESPVFNNKKIERILTRPMYILYILYIRPDRKTQVALLSIDLNWTSGKLSMEAIQVVFEELRKKGTFIPFICWFADDIAHSGVCFLTPGNLEWLDKNKSRCLVMWRRPEEWGKLMYQWVSREAHIRFLTLGLNPDAFLADQADFCVG